jgi:hypothetical protein
LTIKLRTTQAVSMANEGAFAGITIVVTAATILM